MRPVRIERCFDKVSKDQRLSQAPLLTFLPFPFAVLPDIDRFVALVLLSLDFCYCSCNFSRKTSSSRTSTMAVWSSGARKGKKINSQ